jgi:hypothetical protein
MIMIGFVTQVFGANGEEYMATVSGERGEDGCDVLYVAMTSYGSYGDFDFVCARVMDR